MSRVVWRKSSRSGANNANCVEVARLADAVAVRDSKHPNAGMLVFGVEQWSAFVKATKNGEFDS